MELVDIISTAQSAEKHGFNALIDDEVKGVKLFFETSEQSRMS